MISFESWSSVSSSQIFWIFLVFSWFSMFWKMVNLVLVGFLFFLNLFSKIFQLSFTYCLIETYLNLTNPIIFVNWHEVHLVVPLRFINGSDIGLYLELGNSNQMNKHKHLRMFVQLRIKDVPFRTWLNLQLHQSEFIRTSMFIGTHIKPLLSVSFSSHFRYPLEDSQILNDQY